MLGMYCWTFPFVAHVERCVRNIALDNIEKLAVALEVEPYVLLLPRSSKP